MGNLRLIAGLILALAITSFGVVNMEPVTVAYYRGSVRLPLFYVLLAVFAGGFMAAWFGGAFDRLRFRSEIGKLKREARTLKISLDEAREKGGRLLAAENPAPEEAASAPDERAPQAGPASRTSAPPREPKAE